jgi:hypothetical protein
MININPNSDKDYIDKLDLSNENIFSKFTKSLEFSTFRHISDLKVDFLHPISIGHL